MLHPCESSNRCDPLFGKCVIHWGWTEAGKPRPRNTYHCECIAGYRLRTPDNARDYVCIRATATLRGAVAAPSDEHEQGESNKRLVSFVQDRVLLVVLGCLVIVLLVLQLWPRTRQCLCPKAQSGVREGSLYAVGFPEMGFTALPDLTDHVRDL